jgi:hypothetical protein
VGDVSPPLDDYSGVIRTRDHSGITQRYNAPPPTQGWTGWADAVVQPQEGDTVLSIDDNGDIVIRTQKAPEQPKISEGFNENLAERPELLWHLDSIAEDILEGIDSDLASRQEWIANYSAGLDLMGLKIDTQTNGKGQRRNTSRVRDTTMLETIVKAQSQARRELLPAAGPAKVDELAGASEDDDALATDFTLDFNYILTKGMKEYVPGLDRGLFGFFYSGNMFRYGYHCPFKKRPMVETYPTEDVIVSEEATDLDTATRVTLRIPEMSPGEVKRRQFYGLWRDIDLSGAMPDISPERMKQQEISGIRNLSPRQKDQPHVIYQTITDLDLRPMGYREPGAPKGLALPYKVTVERHSRKVLRIERYWSQGDPLFQRKCRLVHYTMVPGFSFLALGFLHLQGNQTKGLTSIVRLLIDAMMFANFPGGVKIKGARTETNEINPGPGEWADIGVPAGMDDIHKVLMPMPYKDLSPVAIQFYNLLQQAAQRVGAAAMLEVGEGRANIPVGTIMAMLEEKSTVMSAIHARMHEAQGRELAMVRELFLENPDAFARVLPKPRRDWAMAEFADMNLVPASDPNIPSQMHRIMLATALATLLSMPAAQQLLDPVDILKRVLRMIGISDPEKALKDPNQQQQQQQQDPVVAAAQATLQAKQLDVQSKQQENQRKAASEAVDAQHKTQQLGMQMQDSAADRQSNERIAYLKEQTERVRLQAETQRAQREADRADRDDARQTAQHNADMMGMQPPQPRTFGGQGL